MKKSILLTILCLIVALNNLVSQPIPKSKYSKTSVARDSSVYETFSYTIYNWDLNTFKVKSETEVPFRPVVSWVYSDNVKEIDIVTVFYPKRTVDYICEYVSTSEVRYDEDGDPYQIIEYRFTENSSGLKTGILKIRDYLIVSETFFFFQFGDYQHAFFARLVEKYEIKPNQRVIPTGGNRVLSMVY